VRRSSTFLATMLLVLSFFLTLSESAASQAKSPVGAIVIDVTLSADCWLTYRTYATRDFDSAVIAEQQASCPPGTVLLTTPAFSEQEALASGGIFVPFTGDHNADALAVQTAKMQLFPQKPLDGNGDALACVDRGSSAGFSYWAYSPGVRIYSTVYYWQDSFCNSGISSSVASLSSNKAMWWRFAEYWGGGGGYFYASHGCSQLSTSSLWDTYYVNRLLGYLWVDESINDGGNYGCSLGGGESYTGSVYLTAR